MRIITITALTHVLLATACAAVGADLTLRSRCEAAGPVVTLGDVADIVSSDPAEADKLAATELFPAPSADKQHFASQRQIQDLLLLRGVNLGQLHFSGASQVAISRAGAADKHDEKSVSAAVQRREKKRLCEAIVEYLNQNAAAGETWSVELELDENQTRLMAASDAVMTISGGKKPWLGNQRFEASVTRPNQPPANFSIDARVSLPPAVIIAARPLARGVLLCAADVQLQRDAVARADAQTFQSLDEVIGRETTRALGAGAAIERDAVRAPLLIRRGEVITVTAVAGSVRVTTNARAKAEGSLGDLVPVESMHDRTTYFVRVSGLREGEVYAGVVKARTADAASETAIHQGVKP